MTQKTGIVNLKEMGSVLFVDEDDFKAFSESIRSQINTLREAGQKEYAHSEACVYECFKRSAELIGVDDLVPVFIFMDKHLRGVEAYANGHKSQREGVMGRLGDLLLYSFIAEGMLRERDSYEEFREFVNDRLLALGSYHSGEKGNAGMIYMGSFEWAVENLRRDFDEVLVRPDNIQRVQKSIYGLMVRKMTEDALAQRESEVAS